MNQEARDELFTDLARGYQSHARLARLMGKEPMSLEVYLETREAVKILREIVMMP